MKSYLTNMLVACVASLPLSAMAQRRKTGRLELRKQRRRGCHLVQRWSTNLCSRRMCWRISQLCDDRIIHRSLLATLRWVSEQGAPHRERRSQRHQWLHRCQQAQCLLWGAIPNDWLQEHQCGFCLRLRSKRRGNARSRSVNRRRQHMVRRRGLQDSARI